MLYIIGHYLSLIPDMVKFPIVSTAAMFVPVAYEISTVESHGTQAPFFDDCVIYCLEDPLCDAVIYGGQENSHGNNCYLFRNHKVNE